MRPTTVPAMLMSIKTAKLPLATTSATVVFIGLEANSSFDGFLINAHLFREVINNFGRAEITS